MRLQPRPNARRSWVSIDTGRGIISFNPEKISTVDLQPREGGVFMMILFVEGLAGHQFSISGDRTAMLTLIEQLELPLTLE